LVFGGAAWWWWRRKPHRHAADPLATLAAACRAGDARAALPALYRWCDAVLPSGGERTVAALARQAGVPALAEHAAALEKQALGDGTAGWDGAALLAAARSTERALAHAVPATRRGALPALNPTGNTRMAARLAEPRWAR
jgi:hypothetical protein